MKTSKLIAVAMMGLVLFATPALAQRGGGGRSGGSHSSVSSSRGSSSSSSRGSSYSSSRSSSSSRGSSYSSSRSSSSSRGSSYSSSRSSSSSPSRSSSSYNSSSSRGSYSSGSSSRGISSSSRSSAARATTRGSSSTSSRGSSVSGTSRGTGEGSVRENSRGVSSSRSSIPSSARRAETRGRALNDATGSSAPSSVSRGTKDATASRGMGRVNNDNNRLGARPEASRHTAMGRPLPPASRPIHPAPYFHHPWHHHRVHCHPIYWDPLPLRAWYWPGFWVYCNSYWYDYHVTDVVVVHDYVEKTYNVDLIIYGISGDIMYAIVRDHGTTYLQVYDKDDHLLAEQKINKRYCNMEIDAENGGCWISKKNNKDALLFIWTGDKLLIYEED